MGGEGRIIMTACDVNEVSIEIPKLKHGLFSYYLIEGLKGVADRDKAGLVTIYELYDYVYALHDFDLDNEFIEDFVMNDDRESFELVKLKLSDLDLDTVSQNLVDEYKEEYLETKWYPPIIYDIDSDEIVDGYHRANMLDELGEEYILAWI